jgi:hypothetical protein
MNSILGRVGWAGLSTFFSSAMLAVGLTFVSVPAQAGYELPEGERITNLPHIPRAIPQKEAYETYDPTIGRNFDIKNFWMRADLRVRPEFRNGVCFGGGNPVGGACNGVGAINAPAGRATANTGRGANDFYVQQWARLGIGYDLSPDVNFYMEIIDSATWGANGSASNAGNGGDPLNHNCSAGAVGGCRLGVRAAYVLVRNLAGVQGLSMKAGRQYVIFGNHSLFGHFDWANTGYSHDGIMFSYSTKNFDSYLGWLRNSEGDLAQAAPVGSLAGNVVGGAPGQNNGGADADMIIFYNQIKSIPGFLIEPYYIYYKNNLPCTGALPSGVCSGGTVNANAIGGLGAPKHGNQTRHTIGNRIEMRKGNWDAINELTYQFGQMGESLGGGVPANCAGDNKCLHINAWATRNWIGYTHYQSPYKPRLAFNFDYASGDGRANCATAAGVNAQTCSTANTFENMFPTNHIHMGYMDVQAWKNMLSPSANFQARPTAADHIEFWYTSLNLANSKDNWYRGAQGAYILSKANNTKTHVGDELDISWTRMFADGKVAFQATWGYLWTGGYIRENLGTASNQQWGYVQLWMNF